MMMPATTTEMAAGVNTTARIEPAAAMKTGGAAKSAKPVAVKMSR